MIGHTLKREQIYVTGNYMDVTVFPVRQTQKYQRKAKYRPTRDAQKRLNKRKREDLLRRLVHLNFGPRDLAIHPTYREGKRTQDPQTLDEVKRDWNNFRRRLQTVYRRAGVEFKYIMTLEFSKQTGYHFHVILGGGVDQEAIKK